MARKLNLNSINPNDFPSPVSSSPTANELAMEHFGSDSIGNGFGNGNADGSTDGELNNLENLSVSPSSNLNSSYQVYSSSPPIPTLSMAQVVSGIVVPVQPQSQQSSDSNTPSFKDALKSKKQTPLTIPKNAQVKKGSKSGTHIVLMSNSNHRRKG